MDVFEKLCFIILPLLITAFLYSIVTRKQKEREKFLEVANKFRESFTEEIRFIDRSFAVDRAGRDIPEVLNAEFDKHERAFIAFMGVLSERKKAKIKEAWQAYTGDDKVTGKYTFKQYTTYHNFKDGEKIRNTALKNINALLEFAKPKQ